MRQRYWTREVTTSEGKTPPNPPPPPPDRISPFSVPLMQCPDCGKTFRADEYHDVYCGFPGHGRLARWLRSRKAEQRTTPVVPISEARR